MASEKQIAANRRHTQFPRGPKTPEGKARLDSWPDEHERCTGPPRIARPIGVPQARSPLQSQGPFAAPLLQVRGRTPTTATKRFYSAALKKNEIKANIKANFHPTARARRSKNPSYRPPLCLNFGAPFRPPSRIFPGFRRAKVMCAESTLIGSVNLL